MATDAKYPYFLVINGEKWGGDNYQYPSHANTAAADILRKDPGKVIGVAKMEYILTAKVTVHQQEV